MHRLPGALQAGAARVQPGPQLTTGGEVAQQGGAPLRPLHECRVLRAVHAWHVPERRKMHTLPEERMAFPRAWTA